MDAFVLEPLRHVALDDADGDAFGDGRLAHTRLANEHRVVLGAAREDLQHTANLLVAPDDRVDLAPPGEVVEVACEALQRLIPIFSMLVGIRRDGSL